MIILLSESFLCGVVMPKRRYLFSSAFEFVTGACSRSRFDSQASLFCHYETRSELSTRWFRARCYMRTA